MNKNGSPPVLVPPDEAHFVHREEKEPEPAERIEKPTEWRVNRIVLGFSVGKWRGNKLLLERSSPPDQSLLLFAKDDDEPMPWGRALEELLTNLLAQAEAAAE